jgi:DNA repair protein RecO (recombination protein O)
LGIPPVQTANAGGKPLTANGCIVQFMLVSTPAIILHAFPYGDTSKIARLATRDHGVQSVIAKGAMRPRSPFGASLQTLSAGVARFYLSPHRDLHTLAGFDVGDQHAALAGDVSRYAAATALAELVLRFAEAEPQPDVFHALSQGLDTLSTAPADRAPYEALAALWLVVAVLGFAPSVSDCVRCGRPLGETAQQALAAFVAGADAAPDLPARHLAAHRRLLARFVRRHVADERELPALAFWESLQ